MGNSYITTERERERERKLRMVEKPHRGKVHLNIQWRTVEEAKRSYHIVYHINIIKEP